MNEFLTLVSSKIVDPIFDYWHKPAAALVAFLFVAAGMLFAFSRFDLREISSQEWIIVSLVAVLFFTVWANARKLPKCKPGNFGIGIALIAESKADKKQFVDDLIRAFKDELDSVSKDLSVKFVVIPYWHASEIHDKDSARKYMRKCNTNFLLYGDVRSRRSGAKNVKALHLRQVVMHRPVSEEASTALGDEISSIFPTKLRLEGDDDLAGVEITSAWLAHAARYFISMAAFISGDLPLAESLLSGLHRSPGLIKLKRIPGVATLRQLVPKRLSEIFWVQTLSNFEQWRQTRDSSYLEICDNAMEHYARYGSKDDRYYAHKAITAFVLQSDLSKAKYYNSKLRRTGNALWRFNQAFLLAYEGDLESAWRQYEKAFTRSYEIQTIFQLEEFLSWVLEQDESKPQLLVLRGLLNLKAKGERRSG